MEVLLLKENNIKDIAEKASAVIRNGGIVVAPFDTVYGFLADASNDKALEKIYELKGRPKDKPFGVVVADIDQAALISSISKDTQRFIEDRVPGPYTFIIKLKDTSVVSQYCQKDSTSGIRIPGSRLIQLIALRSKIILAQTSANKSAQANTASLDEIRHQFSNNELLAIDLLIDGGTIENAKPSTIFDLTGETPREIERKS